MENNTHKSTKDTEQYRTSLTIGMNIKDRLQMLADADDRSLASYIRKVLAEHTEKANIILTTSNNDFNNEPEVSEEISNNIKNESDIKNQNSTIKVDSTQNNNQHGSDNANDDGTLAFSLPTLKIKNNPF